MEVASTTTFSREKLHRAMLKNKTFSKDRNIAPCYIASPGFYCVHPSRHDYHAGCRSRDCWRD